MSGIYKGLFGFAIAVILLSAVGAQGIVTQKNITLALAEPDSVGSRQYSRVLALGGGLPIKAGDEIVGAVGVSGTPGKDNECSQAGIESQIN